MKPYILIAAAVHKELSPLINRIEAPVISTIGERKITSGLLEGKPAKIIVTGAGLINTVQALTAVVENSRPSLILQTGCAGAFKEAGIEIGDIGIATEEIDIHLGIEPDKSDDPLKELPFSLMQKGNFKIKNRYRLDQQLVNSAFKAVKKAFNVDDIRIKKGPFLTVSTITATDKRAKTLYKQFSACMEAMEGAGAACLSIYYDLPFVEIRSASNYAGKRNLNAWNLPLAFERSTLAVLAFIRYFEL